MTLGYVNRQPRREIRREPCVCGGVVVQLEGQSILQAVEVHNQSDRHRQWRNASGDWLHPGDPGYPGYPYEEVTRG